MKRLTLTRPDERSQKVLEIDMPNGTGLKLLLRRFTISSYAELETKQAANTKALNDGEITSMEYSMRFLEMQCTNFVREAITELEPDQLLQIVTAVAELRGGVDPEKKPDAGTGTEPSA